LNSLNNVYSKKNVFLFLNAIITQFVNPKKKKYKLISLINFNFKSNHFRKHRKFTYFSSFYFLTNKKRKKLKKRMSKISKKLISKKINLNLLSILQKRVKIKNRSKRLLGKKQIYSTLNFLE